VTDSHCWWSISSDALLDMLRRVAGGENPDLVYLEQLVNSSVERGAPDIEDNGS
jgi:hypothetical protein